MLDKTYDILAGSAKEQRIPLNTLRQVSNELQTSLVCLGITGAREATGGHVWGRPAIQPPLALGPSSIAQPLVTGAAAPWPPHSLRLLEQG